MLMGLWKVLNEPGLRGIIASEGPAPSGIGQPNIGSNWLWSAASVDARDEEAEAERSEYSGSMTVTKINL